MDCGSNPHPSHNMKTSGVDKMNAKNEILEIVDGDVVSMRLKDESNIRT